MDFESSLKQFQDAGRHPGLSPWLQDTVLLYRCRDIDENEFRARLLNMGERLEGLLSRAVPDKVEAQTYQMASEFYDAAADCLETYLEGLEETLMWAETGASEILETAKRIFLQGDRDWNVVVKEAVKMERQFAELDLALLNSLGIDAAG